MFKTRLKLLTEGAMLLAIAVLLDTFVQFSGIWPNGGSVTLCSCLPIIIYAYRRGTAPGLLLGLCFALLKMLLARHTFVGISAIQVAGIFILDYLLAFTVLGFAGLFRRFKNNTLGLAVSSASVLSLRLVLHIISGYIFFSQYAQWFFGQEDFALGGAILARFSGNTLFWIYSVIYNISYMLPEILITTFAAALSARVIMSSESSS